jgi:tight adherence protein B
MSGGVPVLAAACLTGLAVWLLGWGSRQASPAPPPAGLLLASLAARLTGLRRDPEPPVAELLAGLAAELTAGQPPAVALQHAAEGLRPPPCPRAGRAAAMGGDVPAALRVDALAPGAGALAGLAACWEVADHAGAGLALAVARLAEGLRATAQARGQLHAEIAAARASARLLAGLPAFGLVIGHGMGAQPLGWLLGSWPGRAALVVGVLLELVGLAWLARMVRGVRAEL